VSKKIVFKYLFWIELLTAGTCALLWTSEGMAEQQKKLEKKSTRNPASSVLISSRSLGEYLAPRWYTHPNAFAETGAGDQKDSALVTGMVTKGLPWATTSALPLTPVFDSDLSK
jgi:hypothetical protein